MNRTDRWEIRDATPDDIDLIRSLCQRIWPATYATMLDKEQLEYMMDWMYSPSSLKQQMHEGVQFLILSYKGASQEISNQESQAAGYASIQHLGNHQYKLHKLYLLPELQGLGGGRIFMDHIIRTVSQAFGQTIELQVNRSNKAVGFYQQLGFQIVREADFPIGNGYFMNDYVMQIDLIPSGGFVQIM